LHNQKSLKLFKPFLPIIILILLSAFHLPETRSQERSSAADTLHLNETMPENQPEQELHKHDPLQHQYQEQDTLQQKLREQGSLQQHIQEQDTLQKEFQERSLQQYEQQPFQQREQSGQRQESNILTTKVEYNSSDSIDFSINEQKLFLYGEAYVKYENIELNAAYIEIDLASNEIFARGDTDSLGIETGRPVMTQGSETFEAKTMRYNFETKRGIISGIVTEQEGGFLHGETTKKHENEHLHIRGGKYTSCDQEHPHFYIALTRAKVIPDDKVISGPAYLVIEDIPLPLAIPFGFFPNKPERKSGILFPTYGEEASRGFYLRGGGYYMHINDYLDLRLEGDIYSLGSWSANAASNYRVRYKYNGSFRYAYSHNVAGERGMANYQENTSYNIAWQHRQDAKASPNSNFSASVNFGSSSFNKFNTVNPDVFATNTAQSSISFSHRWPDSPFSLTSNISANQNFSNQTVNLRLPSVNFNMARQYPFRSLDRIGDPRWYDNIELSYTSKIDNRLNTYDTLLFRREALRDMQNGFQHDIPLRANFRLFNLLNITPGVTYSGVMYTSSIRKTWVEDYYDPQKGEIVPSLVTDTIPGIIYGHSINPNFSTGLSQNIYGMFMFRDSRIEAIRHVMTPSVGFSFVPDVEGLMPDYYRTVQRDTLGNETTYSIFENGIYGTPSIRGRAGSVSLSLANNIEMKVRDSRDTITQSKKVKILDRLNFSTGYNVYADSLNWSTINMTGNTSLFDNKVRINFNAVMDPYALDENFRRYNASEWSVSRSPGRITRAGLSLTMGLQSAAAPRGNGSGLSPDGRMATGDNGTMIDAGDGIPGEDTFSHLDDIDHTVHYYGDYVDFNVPWNLNIRYNLNYSKPRDESQITQTLNFSGDMSFTPRWKIQFSSGYDFGAKNFTMTNINIYRDLHCWEMRFGVVPFGSRKSWSFSIAVKSTLLQDLKYHTQKSWYDNFFR
jgi:hypothetical protein